MTSLKERQGYLVLQSKHVASVVTIKEEKQVNLSLLGNRGHRLRT